MGFDHFRAEDFERCEHNTQVLLCNILRSQGLYIKKGCGIKIARELAYAIYNKTKWPDDNLEKSISPPSRTKPESARIPRTIKLGKLQQSDHNHDHDHNQASHQKPKSLMPLLEWRCPAIAENSWLLQSHIPTTTISTVEKQLIVSTTSSPFLSTTAKGLKFHQMLC